MSQTPAAPTDSTASDMSKLLAGGGISGAVVSGIFLLYKICKGRRLRSSCCGGSNMEIGSDMPVVVIQATDASPRPSAKSSPKPSTRESIKMEEFKLTD